VVLKKVHTSSHVSRAFQFFSATADYSSPQRRAIARRGQAKLSRGSAAIWKQARLLLGQKTAAALVIRGGGDLVLKSERALQGAEG
jgi:hypothetical protein